MYIWPNDGNCFSKRASFLIQKCTPKYFQSDLIPLYHHERISFEDVQKNVNGSEVEDFEYERQNQFNTHYSAIEAYILLNDAKYANLINYIKGDTQILEL